MQSVFTTHHFRQVVNGHKLTAPTREGFPFVLE